MRSDWRAQRFCAAMLLTAAPAACRHTPRLVAVAAAPASPPAVADSVLRVWDAMNAAWDRGDTVTVGRIFAPELRAATSAGRVLGRDDILKYIAAAGPDTGVTAGQSQIRDKRVRVLGVTGDVAVCTAEASDVVESPSGIDTIVTRVTDVFERRASGWQLVSAHESYVRPPRVLPRSWRAAATERPAPVPVRLTVQNRYFARAGKRDDVYRWRLHASEVLRQLGLTPGLVFRGAGGAEPDAVWEVTLDSAALVRESATAAASPAFQSVMLHMGGLIRRFETSTSRDVHHFVEQSSATDADAVGSLERAARAWIASEQEAFRRKDAVAFQPCPDATAIVLRDASGATHQCAAVQQHMRDRMQEMRDGAMRVRIDSVVVRGDTGFVYDMVHFERAVAHADGVVRRHASDVAHRDVWHRPGGASCTGWRLDHMEELGAATVTIDGSPAPVTATHADAQPAGRPPSYLFGSAGGRGR